MNMKTKEELDGVMRELGEIGLKVVVKSPMWRMCGGEEGEEEDASIKMEWNMLKKTGMVASIMIGMLLGYINPIHAQTNLALAWDYPDGEPVTGFTVGVGGAPGVYTGFYTVTNGNARGMTIQLGGGGKSYYMAVQALGLNGLKSDYSNELKVDTIISAPTNLRISTMVTTTTNSMRITIESK